MGYWATGHVLLAEPNVASLNRLPAGLNWKLYKAKESPIWLVDIFQDPPEQHGPFSEYIWRGGNEEELERFLPGYAGTMKVLTSFKLNTSITAWTLLSRQLSDILEQRVFTFVSDDDITQMTCVCECGNIQRLHCECDVIDLVWEGSLLVVRPLLSEADPDIAPDERLLRKLSATGTVVVKDPVTIPGGGRPIHDIVLKDWPQGAGDPQRLLDMGTGDDFLDLDSRFDVVGSGIGKGQAEAGTPATPASDRKSKSFWRRLFRP